MEPVTARLKEAYRGYSTTEVNEALWQSTRAVCVHDKHVRDSEHKSGRMRHCCCWGGKQCNHRLLSGWAWHGWMSKEEAIILATVFCEDERVKLERVP